MSTATLEPKADVPFGFFCNTERLTRVPEYHTVIVKCVSMSSPPVLVTPYKCLSGVRQKEQPMSRAVVSGLSQCHVLQAPYLLCGKRPFGCKILRENEGGNL